MLKDKIKIILGELAETLPDNLIERDSSLDQSFLQSRINKAITIIGPRRAGKTWFMYQFMNSLIKRGKTVDDFLYINFEDERLQPLAADNFQLILDAWFELLETAEREKRALLKGMDELNHVEGLILTNNYKAELEINGKQVHLCPVYEWLLGEMNFN